MDISIDADLCIGCGNCEEVCPAVFHLDEDTEKAVVVDPEACEYAGCCEAAEENCPEKAITIK